IRAGRIDSAAEASQTSSRKLSDDALEEAVDVMCTLNRAPVEAMDGFDIHAATDVTGFGLLGHAHEMMDASGTTAEFAVGRIPLLAQVRRLVEEGVAPGGSRSNMKNLRARTEAGPGVGEDDLLILSDAQTSGGLLVALPAAQAEAFAAKCRALGAPRAAVVGSVGPRGERLLRGVKG